MDKKFNFNLNGINNDPIEFEDKQQSSASTPGRQPNSKNPFDSLQIPTELKNAMNSIFKQLEDLGIGIKFMGNDPNDLESLCKNVGLDSSDAHMLQSWLDDIKGEESEELGDLASSQCQQCSECDDNEDIVNIDYDLLDIEYLEKGGLIAGEEYIKDPTINDEVFKMIQNLSLEGLVDAIGWDNILVDEYSMDILQNMLKNSNMYSLSLENEYEILDYALVRVRGEDAGGLLIVLYRSPDNKIKMFVPTFANTFAINKNYQENGLDKCSLLSKTLNASLFDDKDNFIHENKSALDFGIRMCLIEKKNTLVTPAEVGSFRKCRASTTKDSNLLKIGTVTFYDNEKVTTFKKDFDIPESVTSLPIYMNFNKEVSREALTILGNIFYNNVTFGESYLYKNSELCYSNKKEVNGFLYINVDFGNFE